MKDLVSKNYDSFFEDLFATPFTNKNMMNTDITEDDNNYIFQIDVPSVNKENIKVSLDKGYMNVEVSYDKEEADKNYIHKERYTGAYTRSYYVGENVIEEDINAKLENGVLTLFVKKNENKIAEKKYIAIE